MTAPHGQGPPRSTVADALALVLAHYVAVASRGAYAAGQTYAVGDQVSSGGWIYNCFKGGVSAGAGPSGMGSQARTGGDGVGWDPFLYVGERYLKEHGSAPRIIVVPGAGEFGAPRSVGSGNVARDVEEIRAYLWAGEASDDLARYAAIESMKDRWINVIRKIMPARAEIKTVNPALVSNIVTFGEDRLIVTRYERQVPRDAAIWNVPITPISPPDAMRPNGDTGVEFEVVITPEVQR